MGTKQKGTSHVAGLALLIVCGCGGEPDFAQAEGDIAGLIPSNTVALVRFAAIDAIEERASELVQLTGGNAASLDVDDLLGGLMGNTDQVHRALPIVLAVSLPRASLPAPVLIVPSNDPAALAASFSHLPAPTGYERRLCGRAAGRSVRETRDPERAPAGTAAGPRVGPRRGARTGSRRSVR